MTEISATREARLWKAARETEIENSRLKMVLTSILRDCRQTKDPAEFGKLRARVMNRIASEIGGSA